MHLIGKKKVKQIHPQVYSQEYDLKEMQWYAIFLGILQRLARLPLG